MTIQRSTSRLDRPSCSMLVLTCETDRKSWLIVTSERGS